MPFKRPITFMYIFKSKKLVRATFWYPLNFSLLLFVLFSVFFQWCLYLQDRVLREIYLIAGPERNQQCLCQVNCSSRKATDMVAYNSCLIVHV